MNDGIPGRNYWGCYISAWGSGVHILATILVNANKVKILPTDAFVKKPEYFGYQIPGYDINSPELVLNFTTHFNVSAGEKYYLCHGEDLKNSWEDDNEGTVCNDVYMYGSFDY